MSAVDLSREKLQPDVISQAQLIAFYLPMHTATRLALPVIEKVRALNPSATIAAYGLYAPLNDGQLREHGVTEVVGPEAEAELSALAHRRTAAAPQPRTAALPRLQFIQPDRAGLPSLEKYATLQMADGTRRIAGATDATRGCKHRCRHCPIVPVYDGQFRVVPVDVVLADIRAQVAGGAAHITFGDPDFFNGPSHARKVIEGLHAEFPALTYDVTIKVEHLLKHRDLLPVLAATGCAFITSAVEAVDDEILAKLEKGHTRADFIAAARLCRDHGLNVAPTFVAFTPWTTLDGYRDLLDTVQQLDLIGHVAPVQWGIRLLVTWQSRLLELPDIAALIGPFDQKSLTFPWRHPDPQVDALQQDVMKAIGIKLNRSRHELFSKVSALAHRAPSHAAPPHPAPPHPRTEIPYLNEPWYC